MRIRLIGSACLSLALFAFTALHASAADAQPEKISAPGLYVFENGLRNCRTPIEQAEMIKELGYAGVSLGGGSLDHAEKKQLDYAKGGSEIRAIYVGCNVDANGAKYDARLPGVIEQYKGTKADIWLYLPGRASREAGNEHVAKALRELGAMAEKSGLRVVVYPHANFFVERFDHAVELVKKVDRKNVGVCFNLCHFLKTDKHENLTPQLKGALPHVFWVNINGADKAGTSWAQLIQPLDRGDFDLGALLSDLRKWNYKGLYGQQCYGIRGNPVDFLTRSIKKWNELQSQEK